jgi:hypothetical protein
LSTLGFCCSFFCNRSSSSVRRLRSFVIGSRRISLLSDLLLSVIVFVFLLSVLVFVLLRSSVIRSRVYSSDLRFHVENSSVIGSRICYRSPSPLFCHQSTSIYYSVINPRLRCLVASSSVICPCPVLLSVLVYVLLRSSVIGSRLFSQSVFML